jgi:hypothetical protein
MTPRPTNPPASTPPTQAPEAGNKTSAQAPKTWSFGLGKGNGFHEKTAPPLWSDFGRPLKQVGFAVVGLFVAIWLISVLYKTASGWFTKNSATEAAASPTATLSPSAQDSCLGMTAKMQTAKVSAKQVDKIFWQKHPNLANKSIGNDASLRQEWCQIAEELVGKK